MLTKLKKDKKTQIIALLIIIALCILSAFIFSKPIVYTHIFSVLEERRNVALTLTTTSTAIATAFSLLPSEAGEVIAELLTNAASYGIIITSIICVEKILLRMLIILGISILMPIALTLRIFYLCNKKDFLRILSIKLIILGTVLVLVIPVSTVLSVLIEKAADTNYQEAIVKLEESANEENITQKIKEVTSNVAEYVKEKFNYAIDIIAVTLITTCLIPLGGVAFLLWMIKMLFKVEIKSPKVNQLSAKLNQTRREVLGNNSDYSLVD